MKVKLRDQVRINWWIKEQKTCNISETVQLDRTNVFKVPTIISWMGKATNFKFCAHFYTIDQNKSLLATTGKVAVGVAGDSRHFSGSSSMYRARCADIFEIAWLSCLLIANIEQESRAVARITARCAQCMGDLKKWRIPWLRIWLLFLKVLMGFCSNRPCQCICEFDVRGFTSSWNNRGYPHPFSLIFLSGFCSDRPC